jgi:DNA-binding GntR family transcriptional regulator
VAAKASAARGAAKDRALAYVKNRVLTGEFPGGELITEGEIAAALGMSRTPVREAFLRLEAEGLLRLYPQRGALVVPVSSDEVRAVIEARRIMEKFAAAKVIRRGSAARAEAVERLSSELQRQREACLTSDIHEFLDSDRAFHCITLDEADNPILAGFYASLRDRQMRMIGESAIRDQQRLTTILDEHRAIADAVRDGDPRRADNAIETHLASTMNSLGLASEPASPVGDHGA